MAEIFADAPSSELSREEFGGGMSVVDLLCRAGVCKSKGEGKRLIKGGGLTVNGRRIASADARLEPPDLISDTIAVIRVGKKKYHLARFQ